MTREEYEKTMLFTDNDTPVEEVFSDENICKIQNIIEGGLQMSKESMVHAILEKTGDSALCACLIKLSYEQVLQEYNKLVS